MAKAHAMPLERGRPVSGGFLTMKNRAAPKLPTGATGEFGHPIKDFYLTNSICRTSPTLARCSAELLHGEDFAEAAE